MLICWSQQNNSQEPCPGSERCFGSILIHECHDSRYSLVNTSQSTHQLHQKHLQYFLQEYPDKYFHENHSKNNFQNLTFRHSCLYSMLWWSSLQVSGLTLPSDHNIGYQTSDSVSSLKFHNLALFLTLALACGASVALEWLSCLPIA